MKKNTRIRHTITYIFCITGLIVAIFPLLWTFLSALKPSQEMFAYPPTFIPERSDTGKFCKCVE